MLNALFQTTTIPVLEQAVGFAQARHGILAGNIANMDTPGYRVRDLSPSEFQARLKKAILERDRQASSGDLSVKGESYQDSFADLSESLSDILYHDDSSGSLEKQVLAITKNQMEHNFALAILTSQFRLLQSAIAERA